MLENGYGLMPNDVLFDETLTSTAKLLFVYVSSLCASRGYCFASNDHMAKKFNISAGQISRLLGSLEKYVEISNGSNEKRTVRLRKNAYVPTQKAQGCLRKKRKHNSTSLKVQVEKKTKAKVEKATDMQSVLMAGLMLDLVIENFAFVKRTEKKIRDWSSDIEKIHRIDGYDYKIIEAVIRWSAADNFWKQNIRSGDKLRKQFETLLIRIKSEPKNVEIIS